MNQSRKLTEGAIFVAIFIVLMLVSFIPLLSAFVIVLLPVPFIIYTSRHGMKPGLLVLAVATLISMLFFTIFSLPLTFAMGVGGLCIGHAIHKNKTAYETWGYGILGFIFGLLFAVAFSQVVFNVNFMNELETMAMEQIGSYVSIMESFGLSGEADIDLEALLREQISLFLNLVPAFLALAAVFMSFLAQWISYKIINRIDKKDYRFSPFRNLRLPASILWLYLLVVIISFFDIDRSGIVFVGIQNALFILEMLLALQGFSFMFFFAHYKKISRTIPVLVIIATFLFPLFLLPFVRILGIIDIGLNLRDRMKANKDNQK